MFDCDRCGLCCVGLNKSEVTAELHNGDGICKHLDRETMLCRIYNSRPIFCRVEDYYNEFLADKLDKEEYMKMNYEACKCKKQEWEACGRDLSRMTFNVPDMGAEKEAIVRESIEKIGKDSLE